MAFYYGERIDWEQGEFLQPQHLQLTDRYHDYKLARRFLMSSSDNWGIHSLEFDAKLLENKIIAISEAIIVLPDGTLLEIPQSVEIEPRSLAKLSDRVGSSISIYLGVKDFLPNESNVASNEADEQTHESHKRFKSSSEQVVSDLYHKGPDANIKRLKLSAKLFLDTELAQLQHYQIIQIGKFNLTEKTLEQDNGYIPPILNLLGSKSLQDGVQAFYMNLLERVNQLEQYKRQANVYDQMHVYVKRLSILLCLSKYLLPLKHFLETKLVHPEQIYLLLISLFAEVTAFSDQMTVLGDDASGKNVLVKYDHENLQHSILDMCDQIILILQHVILTATQMLHLHEEDNFYVAQVPNDFIGENSNFYLVIQSKNKDIEAELEHYKSVTKLCAYSDIKDILSFALPGVTLTHLTSFPPGIPSMSNALYFRIDKSSSEWLKVETEHKVAVSIGDVSSDIEVYVITTED